MAKIKIKIFALAAFVCSASGFGPSALPAARHVHAGRAPLRMITDEPVGRRNVLALSSALALGALVPQSALASGGATAGKYTTIPIAKRRYFGRVKQGVYEFTLVGAAIRK
eukprot:3149641-Prymnesium_polylepis.1